MPSYEAASTNSPARGATAGTTVARLSFPIGRQRLAKSVRPSEAGYTRAIRGQMQQIVKNMEKVIKAIEVTSEPALKYALMPIYTDSQELVPVDTGDLKASGYIVVRRVRGQIIGEVGYGKAGVPHYGVYVHERMDLQHASPTQAKFLEEPVMRHINDIPRRYAEYVRSNLGL